MGLLDYTLTLLRAQSCESPISNLVLEVIFFIKPSVHAVFGQAVVQCPHEVTIRMGVAEEDFEEAIFLGHKVSRYGVAKLYNQFCIPHSSFCIPSSKQSLIDPHHVMRIKSARSLDPRPARLL
jgi:hypothetical protein